MIEQFFKALSVIFHPILIPIMGIYFACELPTIPQSLRVYDSLFFFPEEAKIRIYIVMAVLTFAAPLLSILIMYWNGMISSLTMEKKNDRYYPFIISTFYFILAFAFVRYQWPEELRHPALVSFLFGIVVLSIISVIMTRFIKISAHALSSFGLVGFILAYNQGQIAFFENENFPNLIFIIFLIVLSGLIATGRLYLKAHSLKEIILGMILGFGIMYTFVKFEIYI